MALQFDQLNNQLSVNDTTSSNISLTLAGQGTGGLNIKNAAQNYILYSEQFQQTNWVKSVSTITADATTAPNGTTTADFLVEDTSATAGRNTYQQASVLGGATLTFSCYLKPNGRRYVALDVWDGGSNDAGAYFDITAGTFLANSSAGSGFTTVGNSITSVGNGWYRCSITVNRGTTAYLYHRITFSSTYPFALYTGDGTSGIYLWGAQVEIAGGVGTYIATTTATVTYTVPYLGFNGSNLIGLQSDGSLYVSPAGTGALQAQATTSTTAGGNARGANAVDWQTLRNAATQVASGAQSVIAGGAYNFASAQYASVLGGYANNVNSSYSGTAVGGYNNSNAGSYAFIGGGFQNVISAGTANTFSFIGGGYTNYANGIYNFIGAGQSNSGTSSTAVTTQSATMNATTAVTLAASNASIKVGQYITGTSIAGNTYVAAISGTSLTLSQVASGSGTATLSFYTPHGVVVGGGNNQATGAYSFIGGGGDAGTAANRNVASGDWSFVGGGIKNTASGLSSFVGGGGWDGALIYTNTASGIASVIAGGLGNTANSTGAFVGGGAFQTAVNYAVSCGGYSNTANGAFSSVLGGRNATVRSITGNMVFSANSNAVASGSGFSQAALLIVGKQTTDATATVLTSDGGAAGTVNQVILPNNSAYYFKGEVVSGVTGGGDTKGWSIEGVIKRGANAASTALVGTPTVTSLYADVGAATWTIAVTADTTNGGLAVTFTGQAGTTIRTVAQIRTTEMTY